MDLLLTQLFFIRRWKWSIALDGGLYFKISTHLLNLNFWERIVKLSEETNINSFRYTNIPRAQPFYLQYYRSYDASGGDGRPLWDYLCIKLKCSFTQPNGQFKSLDWLLFQTLSFIIESITWKESFSVSIRNFMNLIVVSRDLVDLLCIF